VIAEVMLDLKTNQIQSGYDYLIPKDLEGFLVVGMRVVVPFSNTTRVGLVTAIKSNSAEATKTIIEPFDLDPLISKEQLHLIDYLEKQAMIPKQLAYYEVIPNVLQIDYKKKIHVIHRDALKLPLSELLTEDHMDFKKTWMKHYNAFKTAESKKIIHIENTFEQKKSIQMITTFESTDFKPKTPKQQALWTFLSIERTLDDVLAEGYTKAMLMTLVEQTSVKTKMSEKMTTHRSWIASEHKVLTVAQNQAIEDIAASFQTYQRHLLKGVSASGKTEVFLQLCLRLQTKAQQALIITLDEALVAQMADYISPYLSVSTIHSRLTEQQKLDAYRAIQLGFSQVLITTPSGLFTPFKSLGLIIADEAQDRIYLDYAKKVHGLDVLVERAKYHKVPLVYASATPPVQLLYDAQMGKLNWIELTDKIFQSDDEVIVVDMKKELETGNLSMLSKTLHEAINQTLNKKEQVLILANRSGYAPYVMCRSCGHVPSCEYCDTPLVYHKEKHKLKCHHCGYSMTPVYVCSACGSQKIKPVGIAIEQVESHIKMSFPRAKVSRLDADSTTKKGVYVDTIQAFKNKEIDILIGTQMISKGHDFDIPLVGILLIDSMLKAPTYLANERTYQLIKQMMGRTGRKQKGLSIIQTYQPDHFVMKTIQDESAFYEQELSRRMLAKNPPYTQLLTLVFKGKLMDQTEKVIQRLKQTVLARHSQYEVIGPSESQYNTYKLMIKTQKRQDLSTLITWIKQTFENPSLSIAFYRYDDEV
jgi:primosomal protein N' (replication factor Y) (superfamily II helicase)